MRRLSLLVLSLSLCCGSLPAIAETPSLNWAELREKAHAAEARGDSQTARACYEQAVVAAKDGNAGQYFISLEDIGTFFWNRNDAHSAIPYFRTAVLIMDRALDSGNPVRPVAFSNLAAVLRYTGAMEESEALEFRALAAFHQQGALVDAARCYAALAEIAVARGDIPHGISRLKTAADMLDNQHSRAAGATLTWIAENFLVLNMVSDAAFVLDRAQPILEAGADNDPDFIGYLDTRGALLFRRNRYAEAERVWREAAVKAEASGPANTTIRVHLAQLYTTLHDYPKAVDSFTRVLDSGNPTAPARAIIEGELAWALLQDNDPERAETSFHAALTDMESLGLGNCTAAATVCARYAQLYVRRKEWNRALPLLRRAISINQNLDRQTSAGWLLQCSDLYKKVGDRKSASEAKALAQAITSGRPLEQRQTVDLRELQAANHQP